MIPPHQLVSLSTVPEMGPRRIRALLHAFSGLDDLEQLSIAEVCKIPVISIEDILSEFPLRVPSRHIELMSNLSREEMDVYLKLGKDPVHMDEFCEKLKKNSPELFSILLSLELTNLV